MSEGPVEPPKPYPKRALARGVVEGALEIVPGASLLTSIYAVTHPPIEELERQQWEVDVSRCSNEQDELLKRLVGAHLRMCANHQRANDAQQLSFIRGGMVSTLEAIARDGLSARTEAELRQKIEATTSDVEELLEGLDAVTQLVRSDLRLIFARIVADAGLSQTRAAKVCLPDQPPLSKVLSGRSDSVSTDQMLRWLVQLGCRVEISVQRSNDLATGAIGATLNE